ncbi:MAG: C4-type zinc ribbon domain-containing protein [Candidatus Omnitrophica bacterium]|nr:C4-type zinc ribbon domain-containing protein [Candidatus Omnitrophota bacterium]
MATVDLKSQLSSLIKLQAVDSQIYSLRSEKASKPEEIKVMELSFEAKKASLAELDKKSTDLQKQRKERELELGSKDEAMKKLQSQLYSLKTNKEYQTMLQQIQDAKADASVIEDKILELFDKTDALKVELEKEKQKLKEEEQIFLTKKKQVDDRVKEIDERLSALEAQRKQALQDIDAKILSQYERILANRDGLAIVIVKGNSCGGCNMFVPPQVINLIKMYEHIITCEMCNRILYIDEGV